MVTRTKTLKWKKIGTNQWESTSKNKKHDFVIEKDKNIGIILNVFDSSKKNKSNAFIESFECDTLSEAKKDAFSYV